MSILKPGHVFLELLPVLWFPSLQSVDTKQLNRSYSDELGKWMEVGNSGMFRPEMLRPMGLPEDVSVIAWGLSLERWARVCLISMCVIVIVNTTQLRMS